MNSPLKFSENGLHHSLEVLTNLRVAETNHVIAASFESKRPLRISENFAFGRVHCPVNFDR